MNLPTTVRVSTAHALLEALSPRSPYFADSSWGDWVFRGQADSTWGLVPSALRPGAHLVHGWTAAPWSEWSNVEQIQAELVTIAAFLRHADEAGLPIPNDSFEMLDVLRSRRHEQVLPEAVRSGEVPWPPREMWPVIALAQHYGLPTRFLDFTRSPQVAVYFAATDGIQSNPGGLFAVWAFSTVVEAICRFERGADPPDVMAVTVTAPYASNPNLAAQKGMHVALAVTGLDLESKAFRPDFVEYVLRSKMAPNLPPLLRFELPCSEAPFALKLLANAGVSAAQLFPGYGGAARAVLERRELALKWPHLGWR